VVSLDKCDTPGGGGQNVNGERSHTGADLDQMIALGGLKIGDDCAGKVGIEEEILTEHLARPHPDLVETGAEFGFGHRGIHKALGRLVPVTISTLKRGSFSPLFPSYSQARFSGQGIKLKTEGF
jgi:hypothetical protein